MGLIRRTHFTLSVFRTNHPPQHPSLSQVLFGQDASSQRTNAPSPQTMSVFHSLAVVPIFGFNVALTPSDHFRIDSKQPLATSQNYQSLLPFKHKERLQHSPSLIYTISCFFTFAGTPAAMQLSGISEQTTAPAAITLLLPIRHPGRTITPAPIQTLSPIRIS